MRFEVTYRIPVPRIAMSAYNKGYLMDFGWEMGA